MNPHSRENPYPADAELLAKLSTAARVMFEEYIDALDAEIAKRNKPYGEGSLWTTTGAVCWLPYFEDGYSPSDAVDEDLSNDTP